ncbi:MAG: PspC domain-containing protein [Acidimicrobiia bacterium]|jgi:phage shock protein PspC (stress-responsive transcriptional regulator)
MEQTEGATKDQSGWQQRSKQLIRPREGRILAGVAKGVADNFGIADWIVRVFFVVTAFFGGFGVVLYAAGWAFIRSEDETESPAERFFGGASSSRSWIGIGFIVIAGIIVLSNFTILSGEVIWAAALLVIGLLLYLGYLPGESKADDSPESKEGVQRMTSTQTTTTDMEKTPAGDSPAGGIPSPPQPPPPPASSPPELPPARTRESSILGRLTVGFVMLGLGVLAILDNIESLPIEAHPRHYVALSVTILGVGLLVGSVAGRARWLILVGAILVPTLVFSPVFEYDWSSDDFDQTIRPASFTELETQYAIDVGELTIDLRSLPWDGQEVVIDASVDAGNLEVFVPVGVGIVGSASVDIGMVSEPGRSTGGLGNPTLDWDTPGEDGTVFLDAHVDLGNIDIGR